MAKFRIYFAVAPDLRRCCAALFLEILTTILPAPSSSGFLTLSSWQTHHTDQSTKKDREKKKMNELQVTDLLGKNHLHVAG